MKQYVIDEFRFGEYEKIKAYLDMNFDTSGMDGLYWITLDEDMLTDVQKEHVECKPFYFSVELEENRMSCELLVRTKNRIRCNCICYATEPQRNWLIRRMDAMFDDLNIQT